MKKEKKLEKDIQREICEWLEKHKLFFWRSNNVPVFARSGDGKMRYRAMPKFSKKGIPDIIMIYNGRFIGIEVKRQGFPLREEQMQFSEECRKNGGIYMIVHDTEELQNQLYQHTPFV